MKIHVVTIIACSIFFRKCAVNLILEGTIFSGNVQ